MCYVLLLYLSPKLKADYKIYGSNLKLPTFHAVRQFTIYTGILTSALSLDKIIYKREETPVCFGLFRPSSGRYSTKSSGRYSTKIFRDVFNQSSGRYSTKIFRDFSTKIVREIFNKNLQGDIQLKSSGRYSTKIFWEIFNKESSLLNTFHKMAEKG